MLTHRQLYYSFPVRLLALHFRNHLMLIGIWVALGLLMTGVVGSFFGMHYLLLTPEYLGEVNFWSFFITGAAFGAFFMIWNLTTYLLSAHRFSFLASLEKPFSKFCLNNSLIPLTFLAAYLTVTTWFQWHDELSHTMDIVGNVVGFLCGATSFVLLLAGYLHLTNKDIGAFLKPGKFIPQPGSHILAPEYRIPTLWEIRAGATRWRVDTYLNEHLRPRLVRSVAHYNPEMLGRVFRQNHFNAVVVQVVALLVLMSLGLFMNSAWARIPTGATLFLLASMGMAMFGAVVFWFRHWAMLVTILVLLVVNFVTALGFFNYRNRAYGLDYQKEKCADYDYGALQRIITPENLAHDEAATRLILDHWLAKNRAAGHARPKLVFLCVSGGGMRSALWTMRTLQQADSATQGKLLRQSALISGASGGMLGAAYLREVYLQQQNGQPLSVYDPALLDNLGKDLLNPVSFAILSNDLFFPLSEFQSGRFTYRKDRGYLLERQMNENMGGLFNKRLADYRVPEAEAKIPLMFVTPFILNDARRLCISPQGVTYMMRPPDDGRYALHPEIDAVDFSKLFAHQDADSLAFASAIRMNCTYPFILPNVWLPTHPAVEVMDAGFRDNYGLLAATRFVHVFRDWIQANTSGVVFVQIRCWEKIEPVHESEGAGIFSNVLTTFGAIARLTSMQDYEQDNTLALLDDLLGKNQLQVIRFIYHPVQKEREATMSLHLSKREKLDLLEAFGDAENQRALKELQEALQ